MDAPQNRNQINDRQETIKRSGSAVICCGLEQVADVTCWPGVSRVNPKEIKSPQKQVCNESEGAEMQLSQ